MDHPLTPREKALEQVAYEGWAQGLPGCEWGNQTETQKRAWSKAANAILTALASGSGDHAELAKRLRASKRNRHGIYGRVLVNPDGPAAADALESLLAENAALRGENERLSYETDDATLATLQVRATEAERKLAEAVGLNDRAAELMRQCTDPERFEGASTLNVYANMRAWLSDLSKEAERG